MEELPPAIPGIEAAHETPAPEGRGRGRLVPHAGDRAPPAGAELSARRSICFPQPSHRVRSKITLMGPDRVARCATSKRSRAVYADADAFLADVVAIQRQMVGELVEAGCDYVQIDEPSYTGYVDPPTLERMRARGEDPMQEPGARGRRRQRRHRRAQAAARSFGLHICRGNRASMWHREGKYDADRRSALRRPGVRPAAARVRHRARRQLRAAALRPEGRRSSCSV